MADVLDLLRTALAERYTVERRSARAAWRRCTWPRNSARPQGRHQGAPAGARRLLGAERFLREIKVAAQLQHPNILAALRLGRGRRAPLLRHAVRRRRVAARPAGPGEAAPDRRGRPAHREMADALALRPHHGIVHRDIKPENIMLQDGHALVADFGIARAVRRRRARS